MVSFFRRKKLKAGGFYNTKIQIWTKDIIEAIIKIVRRKDENGLYHYGATFVGMIDKDALKIDVYEMFFASEGNNGK